MGDERLHATTSNNAPTAFSSQTDELSSSRLAVVTQPCAQPSSETISKKLEFDLRLMLWNLQDLGGGPSKGPSRSNSVIEAIARIIHHADADITAIIEVHRGGFAPGLSDGPRLSTALIEKGKGIVTKLELAAFTWKYGEDLVEKFGEIVQEKRPPKFLLEQGEGLLFCEKSPGGNRQRESAPGLLKSAFDDFFKYVYNRVIESGIFKNDLSAITRVDDTNQGDTRSTRREGAGALAKKERLEKEERIKKRDAFFGTNFQPSGSRTVGELIRWIKFWRRYEGYFDEPRAFFKHLGQSDDERNRIFGILHIKEDEDEDVIMASASPKSNASSNNTIASVQSTQSSTSGATSSVSAAKKDATTTQSSTGARKTNAESTQSSASAAKTTPAIETTGEDEKPDHRGFIEIERIVTQLNTLAGSPVYASIPTLGEVRSACDVQEEKPKEKKPKEKKPKEKKPKEKKYEHYYYTKGGESYSFIYRTDRCTRAAEAPKSRDQKPGDFELLAGFDERQPGMATFVFGDAEVDIIAHHPPAENSTESRKTTRSAEFKALGEVLAKLRKRPRLCFYLADTNADTQNALGDPLPLIARKGDKKLWTNGEFLAMLSDDPLFAKKSLFARAPTSLRRTAFREGSYFGNVLKMVETSRKGRIAVATGKAPIPALSDTSSSASATKPTTAPSNAWRTNVATNPQKERHEILATDKSNVAAIIAPWASRVFRRGQDPYDTRSKAFDKIAVVRGHAWAPVSYEWIISLLHAVAPAVHIGKDRLLPEKNGTYAQRFQTLIGDNVPLLDALETEAKIKGVRNQASWRDKSASKARITQLVKIVKLLSDHAPCVAEYKVTLPSDYPKALKPSSVKPRPRDSNKTFTTDARLPGSGSSPPPATSSNASAQLPASSSSNSQAPATANSPSANAQSSVSSSSNSNSQAPATTNSSNASAQSSVSSAEEARRREEEQRARRTALENLYTIRNVEADGNCLFRAFALAIGRNQDQHATYREQAVTYITNNGSHFPDAVLCVGSRYLNREAYLAAMSANGTWGGDPELTALARVYDVCICVHTLDTVHVNRIQEEQQDSPFLPNPPKREVHLLFSGGNHYQAMIPNASPSSSTTTSAAQSRSESQAMTPKASSS